MTEEFTWVFARAGQRLELRRRLTPDGPLLDVLGSDGSERTHTFSDLAVLARFQADMEAFLIRTGWTFIGFTPDRRTGRDRRQFPRLVERRRWWTDGQPPPDRDNDQPRRRRRIRRP
jgi:hypothetical protein